MPRPGPLHILCDTRVAGAVQHKVADKAQQIGKNTLLLRLAIERAAFFKKTGGFLAVQLLPQLINAVFWERAHVKQDIRSVQADRVRHPVACDKLLYFLIV